MGLKVLGCATKSSKISKNTQHSTLNDYHQVLGQKIYDYQIFIFIRNPFDRLVSFYFSRHRGNPDFDRGAFSKLIDRVPPLENFIIIQTASGYEFMIYNKMKLMRFESLSEGFSELCASLGVTDMKLPHRNASARNGYREYYDEELIQKIETIHGYEISLGNYEF